MCPDNAFNVAPYLRSLDEYHAKLLPVSDVAAKGCTGTCDCTSKDVSKRIQLETMNECKKNAIPISEEGLAPGQTSVPFSGPSSVITQSVPRTQSSLPRGVAYPLVVLIAGLRPVKVFFNHISLYHVCAYSLTLGNCHFSLPNVTSSLL